MGSRKVGIISGPSAPGHQGKEESMNHPMLSLPEQNKLACSSREVTDTLILSPNKNISRGSTVRNKVQKSS